VRQSILFFFLGLIVLSACAKRAGKLNYEGAANNASLDQLSLAGEIQLWARSVSRDNNRTDLDGTDNLDLYGKTPVPFFDVLDVKKPIRSSFFVLRQSTLQSRAPTFSQYKGQAVPWRNNVDFKILMGYAHLSIARKYALGLFPNLNFQGNNDRSFMSIPVYAAEPGDPFETAYGTDENGSLLYKFYSDNTSGVRYATADESDVSYHEFGHQLQHMLNPTAFEYLSNNDLNTLLEALSDVFAAGLTRDENILSYLASNAPYYLSRERTGPRHIRQVNHTLSFPDAYTYALHYDGRVVAGALNDLRKYLQNGSHNLIECSSNCQIVSPIPGIGSERAFDYMVRIAYRAYQLISRNTSLYNYAKAIALELKSGNLGRELCSSESCRNTLSTHAQYIMMSRGLIFYSDKYPINMNLATTANIIKTCPSLGALSFSAVMNQANDNNRIDANEELIVFPYLRNVSAPNSNRGAQLFDIKVDLSAFEGFLEVVENDGGTNYKADFLVEANKRERKKLGWLEPGSDTLSRLRDAASPWYFDQPSVGGSFLQIPEYVPPSSADYFGPYYMEAGWRVRMPSSGSASMTFRITTRSFASETAGAYLVNSGVLKQTLSVNQTNYSNCP
jgi:hypothetical protein